MTRPFTPTEQPHTTLRSPHRRPLVHRRVRGTSADRAAKRGGQS